MSGSSRVFRAGACAGLIAFRVGDLTALMSFALVLLTGRTVLGAQGGRHVERAGQMLLNPGV